MEARIQLLDPLVADQIAAGEVVERPASVVKELVENALDAGATDIVVEVTGGGRDRILVRDDGCGMSEEDAGRACLRHATSKLRTLDDLDGIGSLGFRGEALASIAAVAEVTITTRRPDDEAGVRLRVDQGEAAPPEPVGAPVGTSVEVLGLFDAIPARKKFLKKAQTEFSHISEFLTRMALARPEVGWTCRHGAREIFAHPAVRSGEERLRQVLGTSRERVMLPFAHREGDVSVRGWASRAGESFAQSKALFTYVGGRIVRDRVIHRAVMDAYRGLLPQGRFPQVVLFLEVPPGMVDVNVHPTKTEVRFEPSDPVYRTIVRALRDALAAASAPSEPAGRTVVVRAATAGATAAAPVPGGEGARPAVGEALAAYARRIDSTGATRPLFERPAAPSSGGGVGRGGSGSGGARIPAATPAPARLPDHAPTHEAAYRPPFGRMRVVGQIFRGYIACEEGDRLWLVDQHAAHEMVRFERLRARSRELDRIPSQRLAVPQVVELGEPHASTLLDLPEELGRAGFELDRFGPGQIALRALPAELDVTTDAEVLLAELAADCADVGASERLAEARDALLARVACHGAVRAGDPLEPAEMKAVIRDLDTVPFAATCPHGRPLLIEMSRAELERRVRRN